VTPQALAQEAAQEVIRSHRAFYGGHPPPMLYGTARCIFHGALSRYESEFSGWRDWAEKNEGPYVAQIAAAFPVKLKRRGPATATQAPNGGNGILPATPQPTEAL
jgi:hypothetical protein